MFFLNSSAMKPSSRAKVMIFYDFTIKRYTFFEKSENFVI